MSRFAGVVLGWGAAFITTANLIGVRFNADFGMLMIASLWGIWHIVSGFTLAMLWRSRPVEKLAEAQV